MFLFVRVKNVILLERYYMHKGQNLKVEKNVLQLLENKTEDYDNRVALGIRTAFGWSEFTYKGLGLLSRKLACCLINTLNVKKGDKIAILSESKPEYGACVFASVLAGTITVPLDVKLTIYELKSILSDCEPFILFASQSFIDTAVELKKEIDSIKHIIIIDEIPDDSRFLTIYNIPDMYDAKWRLRGLKSTVFIIYTSGTTGSPKGVEISYKNMLSQLQGMANIKKFFFPKDESISVLSILPMNHLFELTVGFSVFLHWGVSIYYTKSLKPKDILSVMKEKNIKFMIVVPAFLKLLKAGIEKEINANPVTKTLFNIMYGAAKYVPSFAVRKLMFSKIHKKFGGKFGGCISGGAPLDLNVGEFFERIGIKVYQGYGLSETSPVVCVNYDKRNIMSSVGRPFESFEAKTDPETGELLLKGPSVMKGYYNRKDLTDEAIDKDGWLHTGDIAHIDKDGHIYITGRIKNMIVLSGGKKVFPEEVESVLEKSDMFKETCVFGSSINIGAKEGTEEIIAVIVPSDNICEKYTNEDELNKVIKDEVKKLSLQLAAYKRPVNVIVHKDSLPATTTRKIKRSEVKKLVGV